MSLTLSLVIDQLELLLPVEESGFMQGAKLAVAELVRQFAAEEAVGVLEVFLPSERMTDVEGLAKIARALLPPHRRGKGILRFYPLHSLPEVWADGAERLLYCIDPEALPRNRYLRDRFAVGPTPICCDTHTLGHHGFWLALDRLRGAVPVPHDSIVCRSESTRRALEKGFERLGFDVEAPPCRLDRLPHGVDTDLFHPHDEAAKRSARRMLGLPEAEQITLFFGRVTAYSKADLLPLLTAFQKATDRPDDLLLVAGNEYPAGYKEKLREAGDALGLGDRLILHGAVLPPLRPLYYGAADLFVFPGESVVEAFGGTVTEAMASGLPAVVSDWDGIRDHVVHGENGYLIPTRWMPGTGRIEALSPASSKLADYLYLAQSVWVDAEALKDSLRMLLDSPEERRIKGWNGRQRALAVYSWPVVMSGWRELWDRLLEVARAETPEAAAQRRAAADRLGSPVPFHALLSHYATESWDPDRHTFRLSPEGRAAEAGDAPIPFYDATLPLIRSEVMDALLGTLAAAGDRWVLMADLTDVAAEATGADPDVVRFHLGLLIKRGLLEYGEENLTQEAGSTQSQKPKLKITFKEKRQW